MLREVIVVSIFIAARSLPTDKMQARLHPKDAHPQLERESEWVEQKMGGLLLDEERRHGECTELAPNNECPRRVHENCNKFYIIETKNGKREPVMCRNPHGYRKEAGESTPSWSCKERSAGRWFGRKRKRCPGNKKSLIDRFDKLMQMELEMARSERERALEVKLHRARGTSMVVQPAVDKYGVRMTMMDVLAAYKKAVEEQDVLAAYKKALDRHRQRYWDEAKPDEEHKLFKWNYETGELNKEDENCEFMADEVDGFLTENDFKYPSAVLLYTMMEKKGGTFHVLNSLLGQKDVDVFEMLAKYNDDPKNGGSLDAGEKYWLHLFRILYHTIAEMQLRNALVALYKTKHGIWKVDRSLLPAHTEFQGNVWIHTIQEDAKPQKMPSKLYRGMCLVTTGDHNYALDFYQLQGREVTYGGFTSTSAELDRSSSFLNGCEEGKVRVLLEIAVPEDANPCYLGKGMSRFKDEVEYLFTPQTKFRIVNTARDAKEYHPKAFPRQGYASCVKLKWVRSDEITSSAEPLSQSTERIRQSLRTSLTAE